MDLTLFRYFQLDEKDIIGVLYCLEVLEPVEYYSHQINLLNFGAKYCPASTQLLEILYFLYVNHMSKDDYKEREDIDVLLSKNRKSFPSYQSYLPFLFFLQSLQDKQLVKFIYWIFFWKQEGQFTATGVTSSLLAVFYLCQRDKENKTKVEKLKKKLLHAIQLQPNLKRLSVDAFAMIDINSGGAFSSSLVLLLKQISSSFLGYSFWSRLQSTFFQNIVSLREDSLHFFDQAKRQINPSFQSVEDIDKCRAEIVIFLTRYLNFIDFCDRFQYGLMLTERSNVGKGGKLSASPLKYFRELLFLSKAPPISIPASPSTFPPLNGSIDVEEEGNKVIPVRELLSNAYDARDRARKLLEDNFKH